MAFDPDIVVTEAGSSHVLLVVEAKTRDSDPASKLQLKHYLWQISCPVGLLASPQKITLFKNLFTGYSDASIEEVGVYDAPKSWKAFAQPGLGVQFERHVQDWLEGLKSRRSSEWTAGAVAAFEELIIPSLLKGEIYAGGPRLAH